MISSPLPLVDRYQLNDRKEFVADATSIDEESVAVLRLKQPAGDYSSFTGDEITLVHFLSYHGFLDRDNGSGRKRVRVHKNDFEAVAPNYSDTVIAECEHELRCITIPVTNLSELYAQYDLTSDLDFSPLFENPFRSELLGVISRELPNSLSDKSPLKRLRYQSLLMGLYSELLRVSLAPTRYWRHSASLSTRQLTLIDNYIYDDNQTDFSLKTLASLVDLSQKEFSQQFKRKTGWSPYQYVLAAKVERAKILLSASNDSLASIAYACGFSSQQHMTNTFTAKLGVSPDKYRREVRG